MSIVEMVKVRKLPKQECLGGWCIVVSNIEFVDEDDSIRTMLKEPRPLEEFYKLEAREEVINRSTASLYITSKKVAQLSVVK